MKTSPEQRQGQSEKEIEKLRSELETLREKNSVYSSINQDLSSKISHYRQELAKFEDYSNHQKSLMESNRKEFDNLRSKV